MKKLISLFLIITLLTSLCLSAFAAFSDFDDSHWAASYVNTLVADGTINGFEDGTFRPQDTVTRAQFVKMIGYGPERNSVGFADVPSTHWAYEYIMTSGLEPIADNMFAPSEPITRGDVVRLLWKRAGSPKGYLVPPVITRQSKDSDALAWAYTNSIMTGDNNVDLRLTDSLTRAEAAALIVRARNISDATVKTHFYKAVPSDVLEKAYNSFNLIDAPYSENEKITNGEFSMAMARLLSEHDTPDYPGVSATVSFEHKYAKSLNMLCRYYLGEENDNIEYIEKNVTVKDAIMGFMFVTLRTANAEIKYDVSGEMYSGLTETNESRAKLLKRAYQNGISLSENMSSILNNEITHKDFASLLLQFDGFSGFYTFKRTGVSSFPLDLKMKTSLNLYPQNAEDYRVILSGIENKVYEKPFVDAVSTPKETFKVTSPFDGIFNEMFAKLCTNAMSKSTYITVVSSPVLSCATSNGYTFRVQITVIENGEAKVLSDIIKCADSNIASKELVKGESFWVDINSGTPLNTLNIPFEKIYVNQIV